ncbi:Dicarboxylate/Amino Acid:Cation symporter family, partial [Micromonas pusilla CCMP1545]
LLAKTLAGVVVGIVLGAIVRATDPTPRAIELVGFPGELFMRLLRALVLPLIVVSMVCGVCSLAKGSEGSARRVATRLLAAYAITSLVACALGLLVVSVARPGDGVSFDANGCAGAGATNGTVAGAATSDDDHAADAHRGALDAILGTARAAVTPNVVAAAADGNILGVIVASLAFGASLAAVGEDVARPIVDVFFSMNVVVQTMIAWALTLMPVGVLSLVAGRVAATCDAGAVLVALGKYVATVTFALAAHGGGVLPGLYALATRGMGVTRGGGEKRRAPALGCAFAIDSSSATLPVTLRCAKTLGIPTDLAEFALPLGATINMNGTALYEALTVIFIAQLHGVKLGIGTTIVIALTSTIAAVGAAAIPSAGLVTMLIVLQAAGLEEFSGDIGILMSVDWFLDRLRTVVNVEGDLFVASAV